MPQCQTEAARLAAIDNLACIERDCAAVRGQVGVDEHVRSFGQQVQRTVDGRKLVHDGRQAGAQVEGWRSVCVVVF